MLIFKLSAATGFDAPRAFSLVSLRPVVRPEFGLQVVGRVMRVDPRIRAQSEALADPLLSRGTVFLGQGERQGGLEAAAETPKAFREAVRPVTPQLRMTLVTDAPAGVEASAVVDDVLDLDGEAGDATNAFDQEAPETAAPIAGPSDPMNASADDVERQLKNAADADDAEPSLFSGLIDEEPAQTGSGQVAYPLRRDLGAPAALMRERSPEPDAIEDLARAAAEEFMIDDAVIALLVSPKTLDVTLRVRELLMGRRAVREERMVAPPSPSRIASAAQQAFAFNEDIDRRTFRAALVSRFTQALRERAAPRRDLRDLGAVIDTIAVFEPSRIRAAVRRALARQVEPVAGEPIPDMHWDEEGLHVAERNLYGIFPSGMDTPEQRFAEWLDTMPGVRWWLRNPSAPRNRWAVRLMLASGHGFHPDFVIGVTGRSTRSFSLRSRTMASMAVCRQIATWRRSRRGTRAISGCSSSRGTRRERSTVSLTLRSRTGLPSRDG